MTNHKKHIKKKSSKSKIENEGHTISVKELTKRYGSNTVLDDVSFVVKPGRVTGFLGPNGSGKSTLMKIILNLASANEGTVTIGGRAYRDIDEPNRLVGAMLESEAFHPGRSGRNHLRVVATASGFSDGRVDELIDQVGLSYAADRKVGAYSLGMRQRLGLATALLGRPPILLLDEPGNGLDPQGVYSLREALKEHAENGGTVFVSSHILSEVEQLVDDLVVINKGKLVASGSLEELSPKEGSLEELFLEWTSDNKSRDTIRIN